MNNIIVSLAGNMGGGGFGGGTESPSLPLGDGISFGFEWVFDVLVKIISPLGSLFDLMFNPMYTWLDYALSFFGFSEEYINQTMENLSKMELFQMTFFDFLFALLPVIIPIILMVWVLKALS